MKKVQYVTYQDEWCWYVRKPAGIPTSFGKEKSFLELLFEASNPALHAFVEHQRSFFGEQKEFGLLNRLDTPTTGLLYFAKTPAVKEQYKLLQKQGKVKKTYLLEAWGDLGYRVKKNGKKIQFPIAHHRFEKDRMVVVDEDCKQKKIKGTLHWVKTEIKEFVYDKERNISTVLVVIEKGIRHQIRSHFGAIGYALVGDEIYGKKKDPYKGSLSLWSVGLQVED